MPVMRCQRGGKKGWKAGPTGFCYIGTSARGKAEKQLAAIKASQKKRGKIDSEEKKKTQTRLDIDEATALSKLGLSRNRTSKRKVRFKRPPKWLLPLGIEREYQRRLTAVVREWKAVCDRTLMRQLPALVEEGRMEFNLDAFTDSLDMLVDNLKLEVNKDKEKYGVVALDIGEKTKRWNDKEWRKTMNQVVGVAPFSAPGTEALVTDFTSENVGLITKLGDSTMEDIRGIVHRGVKQGKRHEEIAKEITGLVPPGRFKKAETRAKLIARDQVSKLNGQLTQANQTSVGVTEYIWRSSDDSRVRATHEANDDKKFKWSNPPAATGHPGQDINCRCWAEPVFDDLAEAINADPPAPSAPVKVPTPKKTKPDVKTKKPLKTQVDKKLSSESVKATERYVSDYEELNQQLRLGQVSAKNKKFAASLEKAIDESEGLAEDTVFWRGMEFESKNNPFLGNFKKGYTFSDEGFQSMSLDKKVAENFSRGGGFGDVEVLMKINVPKGTKLAKIPSGLDEFILPPSKGPQVYKVTKVTKPISGKLLVEVDYRDISKVATKGPNKGVKPVVAKPKPPKPDAFDTAKYNEMVYDDEQKEFLFGAKETLKKNSGMDRPKALQDYIGNGFTDVNDELRGMPVNFEYFNDSLEIQEAIDDLVDLYNHAPKTPENLVLWRGTGLDHVKNPHKLVGKTITEDAFLSTTLNEQKTNFFISWAKDRDIEKVGRMKVYVDKGEAFLPGTIYEREVIFEPGRTLRILKVDEVKPNVFNIEAQLVKDVL